MALFSMKKERKEVEKYVFPDTITFFVCKTSRQELFLLKNCNDQARFGGKGK